ncbi:hypothetical protein L3Q72_04575 [Vibrio sp. JC009]|uniref:hypothetical protein n=1 Tax=Vibrio sp. JC009 TaxID=2912314 RepID=UPI0023AFECC3|nr:hypothetical protein [Vibrio sp. JC009]WED22680.1 hypothetical protein L3Q72_04575 [Vibrio sp. JC009]
MAYRSIYREVQTATSRCGKSIPCNYVEHTRFSSECDFCLGLHYLFVAFAPERSYSKVYEIRKSINVLLSFLIEYERKIPQTLHLTSLERLTAEVFRQFDLYCKKTKAPKNCAGRLKGAFESVANSTDDGMPLLVFPLLKAQESDPSEPLSKDGFDNLSDALRTHIDKLSEKLEFRKRVSEAQPYSIDEINVLMAEVSGSPRSWEPSDERAFKTLLEQGHPLAVPMVEYIETARDHPNYATDPLHAIYRRYEDAHQKMRDKKAGRPVFSSDNLFNKYFPNYADQAAIALFLMTQTGWNKETVLAIDTENYIDTMTGALNTDLTLIFSEKQKSQSTNLPFFNPKSFTSPTSKTDKYSSYNLIEIAKKLSSAFEGIEYDSGKDIEHNPLFSCIKPVNKWKGSCKTNTYVGRHTTLLQKKAWIDGVKNFLEQYEIYDDGNRIVSAKDLTQRLRPTWIRHVRDKKKKPLSLVALEQGHSSLETTDVHYDSSGVAIKKRRERLSNELELLVKRLRERKFKGLLNNQHKNNTNTLNLRFFTIPGHELPLWACADSYKPDWPESETIPIGQKCSSIHKCLFCSQVCIFEDSLPYLIQREIQIQDESDENDELEIIRYILDQWGDERALKKAARYQRRHPGLLPINLQSLSILFEDD